MYFAKISKERREILDEIRKMRDHDQNYGVLEMGEGDLLAYKRPEFGNNT